MDQNGSHLQGVCRFTTVTGINVNTVALPEQPADMET
tara:strand:+ start:241 stop:351 length:111 start_codon:yes stop_codon:yes gene_type:complete